MYGGDFLKLVFLLGGTLVLSQCDGQEKDETIIDCDRSRGFWSQRST